MNIRYPCPCCQFITLEEPPGMFALCPVCNWIDDPAGSRDPTIAADANGVSLEEAQRNFTTFGACDLASIEKVRSPLPDELRTAPLRGALMKLDAELSTGSIDIEAAAGRMEWLLNGMVEEGLYNEREAQRRAGDVELAAYGSNRGRARDMMRRMIEEMLALLTY